MEADEEKIDFKILPEDALLNMEPLSIPSYSSTDEFDNDKLDDKVFNKEISSGFSDDISGEEEVLMVSDVALLAEAAPVKQPDIASTLPRTAVPPIYHYGGGGQINLDWLDVNSSQLDKCSDSAEDLQSKQIEFDELTKTNEQLIEGSPNNEDLAFRTLPQPNIQYSNVRRPSQLTVITAKNDAVTEFSQDRINDVLAYGETGWGDDAKNFRDETYESQFGYERKYKREYESKQRRHQTIPSMVIASGRRHGSVQRYSISDLESKENPVFINGEAPLRRNINNSNVKRTRDEDIPNAFGRFSLPRRTLSEGSLLSDHETVSNTSLSMIL